MAASFDLCGPGDPHAMLDYIRSQNTAFEAKHLNDLISLDELVRDEAHSKHSFIADPTR